MTLSWSRDRVGPICRTIEDCAMVFNTIHGVDEKDPSTVMAPFQFDRAIKLSSLRIGVDAAAPKAFVEKLRELGANPMAIGPRPQLAPAGGRGGGGGGGETAAAFDFYVQMKAKELGVDIASLPTTGRGGGGAPDTAGRGGGRGGGRSGEIPGDPTPMASLMSRA